MPVQCCSDNTTLAAVLFFLYTVTAICVFYGINREEHVAHIHPPHDKVALVKLKQVINDKFAQLREFVESTADCSYERTPQNKVRQVLCENGSMILPMDQ